MKLIPLIIWIISLSVDNEAHESFTFAPQFQGPSSDRFSPEKQFYLPPESHSAMPYFPMKNFNNFPFPYLPPSVMKMLPGSPSPMPVVMSTTLVPIKSNKNDNNDEDKHSNLLPQYTRKQHNLTQRGQINKEEREEIRPAMKSFQHRIDRIDTKLPLQFDTNHESKTQNADIQSISPRSIVISDIQRDYNIEQRKTSSFQGPQFLPQPGVFISTTETAIPILRLSNEMDLDGSFSYEALGADQTHYVQHSRMENMGGDKEEQVVEGSYSYVGDNGKTYTVHYVADSNGFRASGDHLPVAPPIPEIIQRAVQYNLAEELKKPAHLKSWKEEEKENELTENEKQHLFAISPPHLSNLFTGKTPETFSHSFSQTSNAQNNLVAAASSQAPIQLVDFTNVMQNKQNSGTISPQINFAASQGAHVPSVNTPEPQHTIARIFTTERTSLPRIVNYEADRKDTDQENNKALWRWQYGINANTNQNTNKSLISRSSGEDDISINFSDMTADQYARMMQEELEPNVAQTSENPHQFESSDNYRHYESLQKHYSAENQNHHNNNVDTGSPVTSETLYSTERAAPFSQMDDWYSRENDNKQIVFNDQNLKESESEISQNSRPKLLTQNQIVPHSQTITQTYNYDDQAFESRRTRFFHKNAEDSNLNVLPLDYEKLMQSTTPVVSIFEKEYTTQEPIIWTTKSNIKFTDFIVPTADKSEFKPIYRAPEILLKETTTTTQANIEDDLKENIFLKNIFKHNKNNQDAGNILGEEIKNLQVKPIVEAKIDKYQSPKFIQLDSKPYNEVKIMKKKPLDMAEIMNYLSRNQFESNKVRSKPKNVQDNFKQKNEMQYFTAYNDDEMVPNKNTRDFHTLQQQEELHGIIKNYKVLQRNNNISSAEQNDIDGIRRSLSPPPKKGVNMPPLGRAGPTMKSYVPPVFV